MSEPQTTMRLDTYTQGHFTRGRPAWVEVMWVMVCILFFSTGLPSSRLRAWLLRLFGAHVGEGVVIKQSVKVKFPWRLRIGDHSWIGERVWIDNLAPVEIGCHACVSQDAYICTGNHDWRSTQFDLRTSPVVVGDEAWICARSVLGPGVTIGDGAIVSLGAVAVHDVPPWHILKPSAPELVGRKSPSRVWAPQDGEERHG